MTDPDEREPTDTEERPEDTVRRLARRVLELEEDLATCRRQAGIAKQRTAPDINAGGLATEEQWTQWWLDRMAMYVERGKASATAKLPRYAKQLEEAAANLLQSLDEEAKRAQVQAQIDELEAQLAKLRGDRTKTIGVRDYDPKAVRAWANRGPLEGRQPGGDRVTARPLAPEADLARVLHIAQQALQLGTMIDPEELLCQLLGLDEAQLQEWLEQDAAYPEPDATLTITYTRDADGMGPHNVQVYDHEHRLGSHCQGCGPCTPACTAASHVTNSDCVQLSYTYEGGSEGPAPDQSVPASRARAREERLREAQRGVDVLGPAGAPAWRQAEAGTVQHLVLWGRPLCAADDAGPWRMVAGVEKCAACLELEEVLGRHG